MFYNIYLELDKQNMIYMLAFEGHSIKYLLENYSNIADENS